MEDPDPSVQDWRSHLLNSLKGTGKLDTLKSQLRARLVDQLRDQDGTLLEFNGNIKPSITERILTSLFLDYLRAYGYSFTLSVFLPESQSVAWPAFTFQEMSRLLHVDPTASFHQYLKIGPREKGCLAQQLVMALQQVSFRTGTQDSSTQTSHQCPQDLDGCLREIDDNCFQNKAAESRMTFRTLEERLNTFRQEFETRVDAEVALQVSRIREYEISAVRLEEEGRYRRQLTREREELEQIHKTRLERIREREESLMEQLVAKEKAIETSAYEERQKLLTSITDLRDREEKVTNKEDIQKKFQDALEERDKGLKMKEADIAQREATIHEKAGSDAQMKIKDMEEKYRSCQEQLQTERNLLEAERSAYREDKARLGAELTAVKSDRDLVHSLNERLASDETKRMELLSSLLERLASEEQRKLSLKKVVEDQVHFQNTPNVETTAKSSVLDERDPLHDDRSENTNDLWDDRSLGKGCKICQQQYRRWTRDHKKVQETIKQLERAVEEAEDGREMADQARRAVQLQLKSSDSELLETISLLKKTQHALELERLHHYSLRSQIASAFSLSSQDRFRHQGTATSLDPGYVFANEAHLKTCCGTVPTMKDVATAKYFEGDQIEHFCRTQEIRGQLSSNDMSHQTQCRIKDPSPVDRPSSTRFNQPDTALAFHQEGLRSPDSNSGTDSICTPDHRAMLDRNQANSPCQLDDLAVVDGLGRKHLPFHKSGAEVEASSASFSGISGNNREQISEKQIGSKAGMSHQDEQAKSSFDQDIPATEASKVLIQIMARPSPQEAGLEATITGSGNFQENCQRTNYYVLETHSTRCSKSELEILVNQKTVKHSSASDNPTDERVQTNIDIIEMKSQKTIQGGRCRDNEGCPSDQQQKASNSEHPYFREACEEACEEIYTSKMNTRTSSRGSHCDIPVLCETKGFNLDLANRQKCMVTHRSELIGIKGTDLETKRLHGDEALLSCRSSEDEVRQCTLDTQQHIPIQQNANDQERTEEAVPTHMELVTSLSNQVRSPGVTEGSCTSEPSKPANPTERLLSDLRQWLTNKIRTDLGLDGQAKFPEQQQQTNAELQGSEAPLGIEGLRMSASGQVLESEELKRSSDKHHGDNISISQHVSGQKAQHSQRKSSSTSQISGSEPIDSLKRTGILGGAASSDESFSNPTKRTLSVKNTQEVPESTQRPVEGPSYWPDFQQDQAQSGDEDSSKGSRVQPEQGSYSPSEGAVECVDDFPTAANSNYLDNSDAFSVPESDIYPSGN
ncbi:unnamed protein product [Calypogeia fissa]